MEIPLPNDVLAFRALPLSGRYIGFCPPSGSSRVLRSPASLSQMAPPPPPPSSLSITRSPPPRSPGPPRADSFFFFLEIINWPPPLSIETFHPYGRRMAPGGDLSTSRLAPRFFPLKASSPSSLLALRRRSLSTICPCLLNPFPGKILLFACNPSPQVPNQRPPVQFLRATFPFGIRLFPLRWPPQPPPAFPLPPQENFPPFLPDLLE